MRQFVFVPYYTKRTPSTDRMVRMSGGRNHLFPRDRPVTEIGAMQQQEDFISAFTLGSCDLYQRKQLLILKKGSVDQSGQREIDRRALACFGARSEGNQPRKRWICNERQTLFTQSTV
jgi:hypothetical protein